MGYRRQDIIDNKENVLKWISENRSKAYIAQKLNCKQHTLNSYLIKMNIEYSGNQSGKGTTNTSKYISAIEYASRPYGVSSHKLKLKMLRDGIKNHKCERCNLEEWLDNPIPLELHHVDGNHFNNNLDNIELLCPNCHSLEPNNSGAGKRSI